MRGLFAFFLILIVRPAIAQSYYKDLPVFKATVNYSDHIVTVQLKPVKNSPNPDKQRDYYWYRANQIHTTRGGYQDKLLNGLYTATYTNKNLKEKGEFDKGLKTGYWRQWEKDGTLLEISTWSRGKKNGPQERYEKGVLAEKSHYRNGLMHGRRVLYAAKDSVVITHYKKGQTYEPRKIKVLPGFARRFLEQRKLRKMEKKTDKKKGK